MQPTFTRPTAALRATQLAAVISMLSISVATQAQVLDLVRAAPEASWLNVNLNSISSVWTPPEHRNDYQTQGDEMNRIVGAWSSFAWDSSRSSLIIYGGGHANYGGNDVYTWNGSTLLWERSSLPSLLNVTEVGPGYRYAFPVDGSMNAPASAHTYDNTVYLRDSDRYMTFGGAAYNTGGSYLKDNGDGTFGRTGPYLFDPSRSDGDKVGGTTGSGVNPATQGGSMWENRDSLDPTPGIRKPLSFVDGFADSTVENGKDVVYVGGAQGGTAMDLYRYTLHDLNDPTQDTWELVGINWHTLQTGDSAGALDTGRGIFARTGDASTPFLIWDTSQSGHDNLDMIVVPTDLTGGMAPTSFRGYGLAYDPLRRRFVAWGGGGDIWALVPPDSDTVIPGGWTLDLLGHLPSGAPGAIDTYGGVLGKWQYAPDLDAFVGLMGPTTGSVWIYKPNGWVDPFFLVGEPGTVALLAAGLFGVVVLSRRSRARGRQSIDGRPRH
jgi:hypothetical protein